MRTFALIPAAGKSTRMGRPKLALPLGGRTVLEWVIAALRAAGIEHILVVVGPHVPELVELATRAGATVFVLAAETAGMRETVEHGLSLVEAELPSWPRDQWLLVPGDHPALEAAAIRRILEARAVNPASSVVIPTFEERRGHPALIDWKHVAGIRALPRAQGLNVYLRQCLTETLEVPVSSPTVLMDLDTPQDYEQLQARWTVEIRIDPLLDRLAALGISQKEFEEALPQAWEGYHTLVERCADLEAVPDMVEIEVCVNGQRLRLGDVATVRISGILA